MKKLVMKMTDMRHKGIEMLTLDLKNQSNLETYFRVISGVLLLAIACTGFASSCGVLPEISKFYEMMIFALLGFFLGLFPVNQKTSSMQRWNRAGRGALHFGAIGSIAFTLRLFMHLDLKHTLSIGLANLGGTMFFGLFIWAICIAQTIADKNIKTNRINLTDTDLSLLDSYWYLGYSICIVTCIALVFQSLSGT
jgi:hypothetical protein